MYYRGSAVERAKKIQEVVLRAINGEIQDNPLAIAPPAYCIGVPGTGIIAHSDLGQNLTRYIRALRVRV